MRASSKLTGVRSEAPSSAVRAGRCLTLFGIGALLGSSACFVGCGASLTSELEPDAKADRVMGMPDAAQAEVAGVRLIAQGDAWRGREEITGRVTPMRVRLENHGDVPIAVRYRHFVITDLDGSRRFAALPPYRIEGSIDQPIFVDRDIDVQGFQIAPVYTGFRPDIAAVDGDFDFDDEHYAQYVTYWQDLQLPTPEMLGRALPEGVITPGGHVDGFLYFEQVPVEVGRATFRAEITTADGRRLGTAVIPFVVDD